LRWTVAPNLATERDELIRLRREDLEAMKLPEFRDAPNGASVNSGNSVQKPVSESRRKLG